MAKGSGGASGAGRFIRRSIKYPGTPGYSITRANGDIDIYDDDKRYQYTVIGKLKPNTAHLMPGARTTRRGGRTVRERASDRKI